MTSRPWHIVRWFGFLAIGAAIAIGSGMRFHAKNRPVDAFAGTFEPEENSLAAQTPRAWLAPDAVNDLDSRGQSDPAALADVGYSQGVAPDNPSVPSLDPNSPEAERQIAELGEALAGFSAENVQVRTVEDRGNKRFVFSCDVPTGSGAESFVGEGSDPPSAARHALSRIRAWASAPGETTLR